MMQIALPNKGTLSEESVRLVLEAGYRCRRFGRELVVRDSAHDIAFIFLRPRDIAIYVGQGIIDLGFTGRDLATDSGAGVVELLPLRFGHCRFCYAIAEGGVLPPSSMSGLRIATSYPRIVAEDLKRRGHSAEIIRLDGAVEISIRLGVADAIADVVDSGRTLAEAGLKTVGEPILESEAILIAKDRGIVAHPPVQAFIDRLQGIIVAREYVMVEYDAPEHLLDAACVVTPGIEAPTVSPLSRPGWVAVKSMTLKKEVNEIMDKLHRLGARGIIITDIRTCRI